MRQEIFDDQQFNWSEEWYTLTPVNARQMRDNRFKELKAEGFKPTKFSLGQQLLSKGGIGSGKPHIEYYTRCYGINY